MEKKYEKKCTVSAEKKGEKMIIESTTGVKWETKIAYPEIAITTVLAQTMVAFYKNQEHFSKRFIITLTVEAENDE